MRGTHASLRPSQNIRTQETASFSNRHSRKACKQEGRQLRRNWWAPKLASGSRRERRVGDWQPKHDHGAGGGADVCQQHGWKLKWGRVEPPSLLSRSAQREKETRKLVQGGHPCFETVVVRPPVQRLPQRRREVGAGQRGESHRAASVQLVHKCEEENFAGKLKLHP